MSKVVLVMEQPENCYKCPINHGQFCICKVSRLDTEDFYRNGVHPKCPLRPLPKKQKLTFIEHGQDCITMGWNAVLEEIEGE